MGYKDLSSDINRQLSWDGTGDLAVVNTAAVASTSLVIQGRESTEPALMFVDIGLTFDVISGSTVVASGIQVTAISGTPTGLTATLTLSAPVTVSVNDVLIRSNSNGMEIQGILTALDGGTTTIYNIDRSTTMSYQGNVTSNSSNPLTLDSMQIPYLEAMRRGGAKLSACYTNHETLRMYTKLLTAGKRFNNTVKGDGGFAEKDKWYTDFNGLPVVPDKDCPRRIFFLPSDAITFYVLSEMQFADDTGAMFIAQTSSDSLEARVRFFANLFNEAPAACGVLSTYISP